MIRIPITRHDSDGTILDGTAAAIRTSEHAFTINDFRDLDGEELILPPGSRFEVAWGDDRVTTIESDEAASEPSLLAVLGRLMRATCEALFWMIPAAIERLRDRRARRRV